MYRAADPDARYRYVNIARWRSQTDINAARQANTDCLHAAGTGPRPDEWARLGMTTIPARYEAEQQDSHASCGACQRATRDARGPSPRASASAAMRPTNS